LLELNAFSWRNVEYLKAGPGGTAVPTGI